MASGDARTRLLEAALALFGEKGYAATSTREIADKAGANEVTLFRHFGSKNALFREVLQHYSPTVILTEQLDGQLTFDLDHDLHLLADAYVSVLSKRLDVIRIGMMEMPHDPAMAQAIAEIPVRLTAHLADYFAALRAELGILPADDLALAQLFYGTLFQTLVFAAYFPRGDPFPKTRGEIIDALIDLMVVRLTPVPPKSREG